MIQETKGRFGFHLIGDEDRRYPLHLNVQFYVKSSALSRSADLAISPHLATDTDIDQFVDDAIAALQAIRVDAKRALAIAYEGGRVLGMSVLPATVAARLLPCWRPKSRCQPRGSAEGEGAPDPAQEPGEGECPQPRDPLALRL